MTVKFRFIPVIIVVFALMSMVGCDRDDSVSTSDLGAFFDSKSKSTFALSDVNQLNAIAVVLAKEKSKIKLVSDAAIVDLTDTKGTFKAISVQYEVDEKTVKMVVPIIQMTDDQIQAISGKSVKGQTYYMVDKEACEMKCTTVSPCNTCQQEIIERCKSQTCTCVSGNTGCNASIIFND
ncbi:MAG TPA: hypothetical protein PK325_10635 [Cyclobacteriaceae bacterium]|nr:hypothetical protein [Cyclobacteriaceae bacterium]HMV09236.1 hypothetical protein [Cyclobacteriaceae bacterium]HMV90961.1 hypothetical protein [Cyclobacteriaceae bacterium]HMX01395.1 hypothetical protein [Cyclobacteriaceae bacterium]HMX50335.1 hypothetical protein [Cyclobacteriaceae bacterium]